MQVTVNGVATEVDVDATVAGLVRSRVGGRPHVAVALNGVVVARTAWEETRLADGDRVEVLAPVAGG